VFTAISYGAYSTLKREGTIEVVHFFPLRIPSAGYLGVNYVMK